MVARCVALLLLAAVPAFAHDIALTRVGDTWRCFPACTEAPGPPSAWEHIGYDDALWLTGRTGFSGYPNDEATILPVSPTNYSALYFRRSFTLDMADTVKWLTLRIDYSDGFVAYLNGREIARRNLDGNPRTPVPFNRLATNYHSRAQPEEINVTAFTNALVAGTNVLAVQVHSAWPSNSNLYFSAELMANFNRGPYLQNCSSNQIQVIWKTPVPADTRVEFGPNTLNQTVLDTNLVTTHVATLTNLVPDTRYLYRVSSSAAGQSAAVETESFRTFKTAGPVSFVVFGDGGWNSLAQYQIADVMRQASPDLVIETGDIVYPSFTSALVDSRCFSIYQPQMRTTPFFFALGNHDLYSGVTNYLEAFYLPTNSVSMAEHAAAQTSPEHYYSFEHGDVHFTVLYLPYLSQYKLVEGDPQYRWLTNDLATTRQPWKIVIDHLPMNSSSAHRLDDVNFNGIYDRIEVRDVLLPVLSRYGVQLLLSGHEHGYERFTPTNGVHAITTAGGGVGLYGFSQLDFASALFWPRYNCVKVTVQGDTLEALALGTAGEVFDAVTIQRRLPPARVLNAAWNSPVLESIPANDGDGNIVGQCFDFAGEPIPTLTGQFSNLGRAYVNNDATNLYIGFDRVMIYGNNNIFLFIESPRLSGVKDLSQIGNGMVDAAGQGADGLDYLANLSFTSFNPAIGCILGDEYADGQFRSFARTNLALNIGQGVFRLDRSLSDVPGTRIQQFHLSPEVGSTVGEENANLIEVAIPLAALGGLRPGDRIRLGAVVGGSDFNRREQARLLDTGFLGNSMRGAGQGVVTLEGVEVQLAFDPQADDDSDGFTNEQESLAGTDPLDPKSLLVLGVEKPDNQLVRFSWRGIAGRAYAVQASSLFPQFTDIPGAVFRSSSSVGTNFSYDVARQTQHAPWTFYRVRLAPESMH